MKERKLHTLWIAVLCIFSALLGGCQYEEANWVEEVRQGFDFGTLRNPKMQVETLDQKHGALEVEIADLDGDSRLDIVHTCGDTMDALLPKPYHGLRWI